MGRISLPVVAGRGHGGHVFEVRQDLRRYFPEVAAAALSLREKRFVLDGEIVVPAGKGFSFDALLQRIHPAASRVKKLSEQTPALFLAFDLLKKGKSELANELLSTRRSQLEDFADRQFSSDKLFRLSPASLKLKDAERWLASAKDKPALTDKLEAVAIDRSFTGNAPGGPSRWSKKRSSEWQPLKPKYVVEISYDHFTGGRFRHGTSILRWRPDKKPRQCTFEQLDQKIDRRLMAIVIP